MDLFAYVAAFVTIILALALSDLLQSLHRLVRARRRVGWHPVPLLAAAFVLSTVLAEFFGLWQFRGIGALGYHGLLGMVAVATMFAMAACAALPDEVPEGGLDLHAWYLANRGYLYTLLGLGFVGDFVRGLQVGWRPGATLAELSGPWAAAWAGAVVVLVFVLASTARRRVHLVGVLALLVLAHAGYVGWEIAEA
jgi:hypothetical protein